MSFLLPDNHATLDELKSAQGSYLAVVGALSASARPLVVGGQTYYYGNNNYYQPCYRGSDSGYGVVQNPNE
jgi:hypothetical protein